MARDGQGTGPWLGRRLAAGVLSLFVLVVAAACGAGTGQSLPVTREAGPAAEITIVATDNTFEPAAYTAPSGRPLKVTFKNNGSNPHTPEIKGLVPETPLAPGQSVTVEVQAQAAGSFRIYCEIHEDSGMEGAFQIK